MEIKVNSGESISLAIKKALINIEGAQESSFSGSIWNKILDIVDEQNRKNIDSNKEALYQGGSVRKPPNWQKNYRVLAGQKLEFSDEAWDKIKEAVGLKVEHSPQVEKKPPEPIQNTPAKINFSSNQFTLPTRLPEVQLSPEGLETTNPQKKEATEPDKLPSSLTAQTLQGNVEQAPEIVHETQEVKTEQTVKEKNKKTPKHGKKTTAKPVTKTNPDGSYTTTTTSTDPDGSSVVTSQQVHNIVGNRFTRRSTITTTIKTSPDGRVETKKITSEVERNRVTENWPEITTGPKTTIVTTKNDDGTKTVKTTIVPGGSGYFVSEIAKGSYTMDANGNIISKNSSGDSVTVSAGSPDSAGNQNATLKIKDKNGQTVTIPLKATVYALNGYVYADNDKENFNFIMSDVAKAVSELNPEVLKDLKSEVGGIQVQSDPYTPEGRDAAAYYKNDQIVLSTVGGGVKMSTLNHEIGHAVDADVEHNNQTKQYAQAFEQLKSNLKDSGTNVSEYYALKNPQEFFAEYYAYKYGNGKNDSKKLFSTLQNTDDSQIKQTYESLKNECEQIIKTTRSKNPSERMNAINTSSSWIERNRARIVQVFGADAGSITTENDLYKLYLQNKNSPEAKQLYNDFLSAGE